MSVITKYAVYSSKLKQFWGKNRTEPLIGDVAGFTPEVAHAKLYTLEKAEDSAEDMFDEWQTIAVPIRIIISPVFKNATTPEDARQEKQERLRALAREFDEMSMDEADRLSKTKLSEYRMAKAFVKNEEEKRT